MPAAIASGATVLAEINHALPAASAVDEVPREAVTVVAEVEREPVELKPDSTDAITSAIGGHVAGLIHEGDSVQFGPGSIGQATLAAIEVPVRIDSGVITDAVVDLDRRDLLSEIPQAAYLAGTRSLYEWADGRPILRGLEVTHDIARLSASPFVAVNTAMEIDLTGQVNVESAQGIPVAGIGGHPDYAAAASRSASGLSVVALPSVRRGRSTLVDRLEVPTSTARCDVDIVVNEHGTADLRGLADDERSEVLAALWRSA